MSSSFDIYVGLVIIKNAQDRSTEMVRACRHNKIAWKWLEAFVNSSDTASCIMGHGLMIYAIMVHSGRLRGDVGSLALFGYAEHQVFEPTQDVEYHEQQNDKNN